MPDPQNPTTAPRPAGARVRRAKREVERVQRELEEWLKRRRAEDAKQPFPRFVTQLKALEEALRATLQRIRDEVDTLAAAPEPAGRVFAECALNELRLAWMQRVWFYFRAKFDQRDDSRLAPVLNAADEIIWSCYKPAFAQDPGLMRTAPLPYLEPLFTPNAILRADPPRELLWNTDDAFARACLAALPIPIIGVPASTVGAPWLLALLAHEVGHHVQADYFPDDGPRVRAFGEALAQAATGPRAQEWVERGREVFADVFSVLALGGATLPVIAELILTDERRMIRSSDAKYPPPTVRLALIDAVRKQLELPAPPDAHALRLDARAAAPGDPMAPTLADELQNLTAVAAAALAWTGPGGLAFPELLGWSRTQTGAPPWQSPGLQEHGEQAGWAGAFAAGVGPTAMAALDSPRLLAGAGALAWAELMRDEDEVRREAALAVLAQRLVEEIPKAREQSTRAAAEAPAAVGLSLADRLLGASTEQLASTLPGGAGQIPLP